MAAGEGERTFWLGLDVMWVLSDCSPRVQARDPDLSLLSAAEEEGVEMKSAGRKKWEAVDVLNLQPRVKVSLSGTMRLCVVIRFGCHRRDAV